MKPSNKLWLLIAVGIVLVGCNSFNRYEMREDPRFVSPFPSVGVDESIPRSWRKPADSVAATDQPACPVYQMPALPKKPELPYQKLAAIRPGDNAAVDELYTAHIRELRIYITSVNSILLSSYNKYMEECGKYVSKKAAEKQ